MTTAEASPGDFATKADSDLVSCDVRRMVARVCCRIGRFEERLCDDMRRMEARLIRWLVGTVLTGMGIAAAVAVAVARFFG